MISLSPVSTLTSTLRRRSCFRACSGLLGRVEESQETEQNEIGLILDCVGWLIRRSRHLLVGQGDHPEALSVQIVGDLATFGVVLGQGLDDLSLDFHLGA